MPEQYLYLFNQETGKPHTKPGPTHIKPDGVIQALIDAELARNPGHVHYVSDVWFVDPVPTIEGGVVTAVNEAPPPTSRYVAVDISGNSGQAMDGTKTFIPGDVVNITMTLKSGPDAGDPVWVFSTPPGVFLSVPYRKNNRFAGRIRCAFVDGVCVFNFPVTDDLHGDLSIRQADLVPFGGNQVVLLDQVNISVEKASA